MDAGLVTFLIFLVICLTVIVSIYLFLKAEIDSDAVSQFKYWEASIKATEARMKEFDQKYQAWLDDKK